MAEQTKEVIVEATGVVMDRFEQYFSAASSVIKEYGTDVVDLGLNVLRIEAAAEVISNVLTFIFFAIAAFLLYKKVPFGRLPKEDASSIDKEMVIKAVSKGYHDRSLKEDSIVRAWFGIDSSSVESGSHVPDTPSNGGGINFDSPLTRVKIIGIVILTMLSVFNLIGVVDVWSWIGILYPEVYAVHKAMIAISH